MEAVKGNSLCICSSDLKSSLCSSSREKATTILVSNINYDCSEDDQSGNSWPSSCVKKGPHIKRFPSYSTSFEQPLLGEACHKDTLFFVHCDKDLEDVFGKEVQLVPVRFALYTNGFRVVSDDFSVDDELDLSVCILPFLSIQKTFVDSIDPDYKVFSIFWPGHGFKMNLATHGLEAGKKRVLWMGRLFDTIQSVIESLFPFSHCLRCQPLLGVEQTELRILAGYLVLQENFRPENARSQGPTIFCSIVYCDLQAHCNGRALMTLYEDDSCHSHLKDIPVLADSEVTDQPHGYSTFKLAGYIFAAKSAAERDIWVRALNNLKVKIFCATPNPDPETLLQYRSAVSEQLLTLERPSVSFGRRQPLLEPCIRTSHHGSACDGDEDEPSFIDQEEINADETSAIIEKMSWS